MKRVIKITFRCAVLVWGTLISTSLLSSQELTTTESQTKDRARVLFSRELAKLDSNHLKVTLVEVNYGPGESSTPHSHPCAVFGYVVAGSLRTQVKGEPEITYQPGGTFYEAPNGVHLVSANASTRQPAKLLAYMICDRDAPLSVDVPQSGKGAAQ